MLKMFLVEVEGWLGGNDADYEAGVAGTRASWG